MDRNRRRFLSALAAAVAGSTLDPERLLWVPGKKLISIPADRKEYLLSVCGLELFCVRGSDGRPTNETLHYIGMALNGRQVGVEGVLTVGAPDRELLARYPTMSTNEFFSRYRWRA